MKAPKKIAKKVAKKTAKKKTVLNSISVKKVAVKKPKKVEEKHPLEQLRDIISKLKPKGKKYVYAK
ncbi:MAG: hypothetical protein CFE21_16195 [Bacteroidetes bacterium B1(2017)]|nr:MAG: hypothetical protein CFE21_16195 [Bacteroidetes bacterium B1(2017)]